MSGNSLFARLKSKKDIPEDFITEAFKSVLESIPLSELNNFFKRLVNNNLQFKNPLISTQFSTSSGRNDLVISDESIFVIFENKWDSPSYIKQLETYDNYLSSMNDDRRKMLIHLTKGYEKIDTTIFKNDFKKISWGQVYCILSEIKESYISVEFVTFLKEEGIAMERVSWELINGAKSVFSLTRIIQRACQELGIKHAWISSSSDNTAQCIKDMVYVYFLLENSKLYFTVNADKPPTESMNVNLWNNYFGKYFDFDEHSYFHKSLEEQIAIMKNFINDIILELNTNK